MEGLKKLFPEGGSAARGTGGGRGGEGRQRRAAASRPILTARTTDCCSAVRSGEIPESRIDESVLKILRAKASVGLNKATLVDIGAVNRIVAKPTSLAIARGDCRRGGHSGSRQPPGSAAEGARAREPMPPKMRISLQRTPAAEPCCSFLPEDSRSDAGRVLEHQVKFANSRDEGHLR